MENEQKEKMFKIKLEKPNILIILIGIMLILALISLYWITDLANQVDILTQPIQQPSQRQDQQPLKTEVSADDDPSIGPKDAPITIVEFSDFRCPFCAKVKPTLAQILKTYGDRIRLVFRDFPALGPQSQKAAEAAECADEQGKFWEYHDMLFANQQALDNPNNLKQFAADLELDTSKFNDCLDSGKMTQEVQKDIRDGQDYVVRGVPALFINGILVSGAKHYSVFEQIINEELVR